MLNAFWDKIRAEPTAFGEMIRVWLFVGMAFGLFALTDEQQSILLMAISVTIAFFTRRATTPNVKVNERVERSVAHREAVKSGISLESVPD